MLGNLMNSCCNKDMSINLGGKLAPRQHFHLTGNSKIMPVLFVWHRVRKLWAVRQVSYKAILAAMDASGRSIDCRAA